MQESKIKEIFRRYNLGEVTTIKKSEIGWTNKVYSINNKFILKVCGVANEKDFESEVFFYNKFKNKLPVPNVLVYNNSKKVYYRPFMIYEKIQGVNLYSVWHFMTDNEKKDIIKQLCNILRIINNSEYDSFVKEFRIKAILNWHDKMIGKINKNLRKITKQKLLSKDFIKCIKNFIENNHGVLNEQRMVLVYWDTHFDNILIKKNRIVGIIDFEKTEVASIDFVLKVIKRMVNHPKKYMSEKMKRFARKKDYDKLLVWFKEFYPELFNFNSLDKRLDLYFLEDDLALLPSWPKCTSLKKMIAKTVRFKN